MADDNQKRITSCEQRLTEYDTWRKSLLWFFGKLIAGAVMAGGAIGFCIELAVKNSK